MFRALAITAFLTLSFLASNAQDILVKKNGKTVEGKVIEVGIDRVTYKISNAEGSAHFIISKRDLNRIEFGSGETVMMNDRIDGSRKRQAAIYESEDFGQNMINISPFKALDSGPGFGISYERLLDKKGLFGLILPVTMAIPDNATYIFDLNDNGSVMYYASPGLKIYPFGQRKVTYAVGPNVFLGYGNRWDNFNSYDPRTGLYVNEERCTNTFRMGLLVNNYINFQITPRFQISMNAGLGPRYIDQQKSAGLVTNNRGIQITGEFNFSLGMRF